MPTKRLMTFILLPVAACSQSEQLPYDEARITDLIMSSLGCQEGTLRSVGNDDGAYLLQTWAGLNLSVIGPNPDATLIEEGSLSGVRYSFNNVYETIDGDKINRITYTYNPIYISGETYSIRACVQFPDSINIYSYSVHPSDQFMEVNFTVRNRFSEIANSWVDEGLTAYYTNRNQPLDQLTLPYNRRRSFRRDNNGLWQLE